MSEKMIIRFCFVMLLTMNYEASGYAQTGEEVRKHVIIAIDVRPGRTGDYGFTDVLRKADFMSNKITSILSEIINDDDYVSVVDYGLPTMAKSFNDYTTCTVGWDEYGKWRNTLSGTWGAMAYDQHFPDQELYSLITGAKFFSFKALNGKNGEMMSNKVYILTVSDDEYNGSNDYKTEFKKGYYETTFSKNGGRLTPDEYRNTCINISNKWSFLWEKDYILMSRSDRTYWATLYEVVPNDRPSLPSAVIYPANLGLHRVRGGYELNFDYSSALSSYKVKKLEIESTQEVQSNLDAKKIVFQEDFTGETGHVHIFINNRNLHSNTLNITMRGWLVNEDNIYSGLVLSPYDDDNGNLTIRLELPLKDDAMILGLLPMPDELWWWFPTDQSKAVLPWDIIVVFLFVVLVVFVSYKTYIRLTRYVPNNGDLHIINV